MILYQKDQDWEQLSWEEQRQKMLNQGLEATPFDTMDQWAGYRMQGPPASRADSAALYNLSPSTGSNPITREEGDAYRTEAMNRPDFRKGIAQETLNEALIKDRLSFGYSKRPTGENNIYQSVVSIIDRVGGSDTTGSPPPDVLDYGTRAYDDNSHFTAGSRPMDTYFHPTISPTGWEDRPVYQKPTGPAEQRMKKTVENLPQVEIKGVERIQSRGMDVENQISTQPRSREFPQQQPRELNRLRRRWNREEGRHWTYGPDSDPEREKFDDKQYHEYRRQGFFNQPNFGYQ